MSISLRLETPRDYYSVEELTREAFWKLFWYSDQQICDEHLLVRRLRECPSFVPELDYVAEQNNKLVGHIIYTTGKIVDESQKEHTMLTFGPLSVHPSYQHRGIGKALMLHTFGEARRMGYRAVIIFGHPDYYTRVGFQRASRFGITTSDGKVFDPFMVYPLYDGSLDGIQGKYYLDPVYDTLKQDDALEFDKIFPPKKRHIPAPINALLNRLEPDARAAILSLDFKTLNALQTISERELSMLNGIDEKALKIIRAVMLEHGSKWGIL
ncbi:MAG: N-acetyltransferase [Defluviitaleaceae bacterium]|nr:N-acetyltransferase [Defluviitaleaceae bacterium]